MGARWGSSDPAVVSTVKKLGTATRGHQRVWGGGRGKYVSVEMKIQYQRVFEAVG